MDEQNYTLNLDAPFEDLRLEVAISDCHILLTYVGTAERLIESGAVEPSMTEVGAAKSRPRVDSDGFHFLREVRWNRGTRLLRIARYITDIDFATKLPGAPQCLKFPRLDWLDAHPGRVSISVEPHSDTTYVRRISAGTIEALIKGGLPSILFDHKWRAGRFWHYEFLEHSMIHIRRLMRGYFEVEQGWVPTTSIAQTVADVEPERRRSNANLRLVWTNPATV